MRGQSPEFLRALRKENGLGEFAGNGGRRPKRSSRKRARSENRTPKMQSRNTKPRRRSPDKISSGRIGLGL